MKLSLDLLNLLVVAAKAKNFRDAAKSLGISQATVTNKLRTLDQQLPTQSFVMEGKKKVLTPFGQALVKMAERTLSELELGLKDIERKFFHDSGLPVKVGCRPEVFLAVIEALPKNFQYHFVPLKGSEVGPAVAEGKIDLGFTAIVPDSPLIIARRTFESRVDMIVHRSLATGPAKDLWKDISFLRETSALMYDHDGHLLSELCRSLNLGMNEIKPAVVADSWMMLSDLVARKQGYALVPSYLQTGKDILRVPVPKSICKPLSFSVLVRQAYKGLPFFKQILIAKWPQT